MALPDEQHPVALLQKLIQFDTTNPPGNELECVSYIDALLTRAGVGTKIFSRAPDRPNLMARIPGQGLAPPILLYGHVDVVTTEHQQWQYPPFAGQIVNDFVWGRGALDMKGGVAMMLAAVLRAQEEKIRFPGDVVLAVVSDEEGGGHFGAEYLVENHSEQFAGIRYAISEFGGFTLYVGGRRFYPIQVAEKQICSIRITVRGPGGHGSLPVRDGAMAQLGRVLHRLDHQRLPVHITPVVKTMFTTMAMTVGGMSGIILRQLTNPRLTDVMLNLLGQRGRIFDPLLHNTVSPTILHGSQSINVIPSEVSVELDGRLLPECTPSIMIEELRAVVGTSCELEVTQFEAGPPKPDMGLFDTLASVIREADPEGIPIPLLLSGVTDARFLARLGIQTYGFLPMQLGEDFDFSQTIHAANERIPVSAIEFGARTIFEVLNRFGR